MKYDANRHPQWKWEIVVAPVYWPGLKFSISLHISARRHNFYILANYFLGRVLDFPLDGCRAGKTTHSKTLLGVLPSCCCFFFLWATGMWAVAFLWYARCENKIDVNYAMHTGRWIFTPRFYQSDTSFSPLLPSFPCFSCLDACALTNPLRGFGEFSKRGA